MFCFRAVRDGSTPSAKAARRAKYRLRNRLAIIIEEEMPTRGGPPDQVHQAVLPRQLCPDHTQRPGQFRIVTGTRST